MRFFKQSLSIFLSCLLVLVIITTLLISYIAQILSLIIIFSIVIVIIKKRAKRGQEILVGSNAEVFTIITAVLLAIFLTGGLTSGLFFLVYFLLFGIVFLYEPATVFVLLLGFLIVFFPSVPQGDLFSNLIKIGSFVFMAPLSYFIGREFQKRAKLDREIEDKTGQILEDAQTLREHTENEEAIDEIEDIAEKAEELRKEAQKE